ANRALACKPDSPWERGIFTRGTLAIRAATCNNLSKRTPGRGSGSSPSRASRWPAWNFSMTSKHAFVFLGLVLALPEWAAAQPAAPPPPPEYTVQLRYSLARTRNLHVAQFDAMM